MAENLPLIPEKRTALCADVQSVFRDVFREVDYLPPLITEPLKPDDQKGYKETDSSHKWIEDLSSECRVLYNQEDILKQEFARRLAKEPLPNIYNLESPVDTHEEDWRIERGIVGRRDLRPSIEQDAGRDSNLWIKNILNKSSGDLRAKKVKDLAKQTIVSLKTADKGSLQSLSIGELEAKPPLGPPLPPAPPLELEYIICVPAQLDFINFTVGQLHTHTLRLVNVTKFDVRLSIRPPKPRELDVELCSRLVVTSGAAAELRVHYRPRDVREMRAEIVVRMSTGKSLRVPINCYMEPPLLDILVPSVQSLRPNSVDDYCYTSDVLDLGAKLLGEIHRTPLILLCETNHAAFFLLSEDAWINFFIDISQIKNAKTMGKPFGTASDTFWITPAHWSGGGTINGLAMCRANTHGVHTTVFRILSSTAIVRTLHLVADALLFQPDHVTLQAQEKDYDICSDDDRACEYYVNLGTAYPNRSLAACVQMINNSPITYEYYWSMRRWGVCSCWEVTESIEDLVGEEELCPGAPKPSSEDKHKELASYRNVYAVSALPARGQLAPRTTVLVGVRVPDVGSKLGVQRAVLMLVLKDIPKESFVPNLNPMIVKTNIVEEESIPGVSQCAPRETCDIVVAQMEVWWEVTPVCFTIDQPLLILPRSRRIKSITIPLQATQVTGVTGVSACWKLPELYLPAVQLRPGQSTLTNIRLPLENLPDEYPETKIFELIAENDEWSTITRVHTHCSTRHPALRPAAVWLGVVPPGVRVQAQIMLKNDTHQHIFWWGSSWRWWHENPIGKACVGRAPCDQCRESTCTCALLRPSRGALHQGEGAVLNYDVNAPETDGCVATLIQVRRTAADLARVPAGVGTEGRAALVAYRVLAPRLMIRVLPCMGDKHGACDGCSLDDGRQQSQRGTSVLRPRAALTVGRCACYRLKCTNLTPLPTTLRWETPIEGGDILKVTFIPNDIEVQGYARVDMTVVVKPLKVCGRRIFVHRASVEYAYKPVYLLIDAAIKGLEVTIELPLGGEEQTDSFVIMRRSQDSVKSINVLYSSRLYTLINEKSAIDRLPQNIQAWVQRLLAPAQREVFPWETDRTKSFTADDWFKEEDKIREIQNGAYIIWTRVENICHCRYKMVYVPPKKPVVRPKNSDEDQHNIEIVTEPPSLTRVCPCTSCTKPVVPEDQAPICLQFWNMPVRTVRTRKITVRNLSTVTAEWSAAVRRWPRRHLRTIAADQWASDIREPGLAVECRPAAGVMTSHGQVDISVSVYADCWGVYKDQVLIHIDNLEPVILDLWVEVIGSPLQFAINPGLGTPPCLWMSASDPERALKVTNMARADLVVQAFVMQEHGDRRDVLPFRLYIRFYDIPVRTCPCLASVHSDSISEEGSVSSVPREMDTAMELFLAADYGMECYDHYAIEPAETVIPSAANVSWRIHLHPTPDPVPSCVLLLRAQPVHKAGNNWFRPVPAPQQIFLQVAPQSPSLQLSCSNVRVVLCALDLPLDEVTRSITNAFPAGKEVMDTLLERPHVDTGNTDAGTSFFNLIRKRLQVHNVGSGHLTTTLRPTPPWRVVGAYTPCDARCGYGPRDRPEVTQLHLPPQTTVQLCTEVSLHTRDVWPPPEDTYQPRRVTTTPLHFYDENHVTLLSLPLILEIDLPVIHVKPLSLDFGYVTDGDTRKNYVTVTHSSRTATIDLVTKLEGSQDFEVWPPSLVLEPGASEIIYVQYSARWRSSPADAKLVVAAGCGAGGWCAATTALRARPTRDHVYRKPPHDYTDDIHLLPRGVI